MLGEKNFLRVLSKKVGICPNYPDFLTIEIWETPKVEKRHSGRAVRCGAVPSVHCAVRCTERKATEGRRGLQTGVGFTWGLTKNTKNTINFFALKIFLKFCYFGYFQPHFIYLLWKHDQRKRKFCSVILMIEIEESLKGYGRWGGMVSSILKAGGRGGGRNRPKGRGPPPPSPDNRPFWAFQFFNYQNIRRKRNVQNGNPDSTLFLFSD